MTLALLDGVHKSFRGTPALRGLDLEVRAGEIACLLGPNGAGKTTAFAILTGLRRPDAGRVELFGGPPRRPETRRGLGATPQEAAFPSTLRVGELVELVRRHYPDPPPAEATLERFGLAYVRDRQAGGLSGGLRRRLAVALAFAGRPRLVVLDEPTAGLDVDARRLVWDAVGDHVDAGGTVLFTTHYLEEAEAVATRVVVVAEGRVAAAGTVAEITGAVALTRIRLSRNGRPPPPVPGLVRAVDDPASASVTLYVEDAAAALRTLLAADVDLARLEVRPVTLEEAFLTIVGGGR